MYQIKFHPKAIRELVKVERPWQKRIKQKIELLAVDPSKLSKNIKPLKGKYDGLARLRIGSYRIIFQVKNKELRILIIRIAQRQELY